MSLTKNEQHALLALVEEHDESPRPVSTLIVMAACNARAGHQQDAMLVALASLKRQELVDMRGDAWWPTWDGRRAARMIKTGTVPAAPAPEPLAEAPPVRPRSRDTLRPRQTVAPKPMTRPAPTSPVASPAPEEPASGCRTPLSAGPREACGGCGSHAGQHHDPECPAANAFTAGRIRGNGAGEALPPIEYPATVERLAPEPLAPDLVNRCAAMQLALLADARQRYDQGDHEAAGEIRWLLETGEQLLAAGGL